MPWKTVYDVTVQLPGEQPSSGPGSRSPAPTAQRKVRVTNASSHASAVSQALDRVVEQHVHATVEPTQVWRSE